MAEETSDGSGSTGDAMLWLLAFGNFIVGIGAFAVIGLMSPLKADLALSPMAAGWIVSAYALSYAIASPLLTTAAGRLERRWLLAAALACFGAGMAITAAATSVGVVYLGRVVSAIGAAVFTPAAATVAVAASPPGERGRALALIFTGFTLAQVAGVPAGSWLGYTIGWRWVLAGTGAMAMLAATVTLVALPRTIAVAPTTLGAFVRILKAPSLSVSALLLCTSMAAAWVPYTFFGPLIEWKLGAGRDAVSLLLLIYGFGAMAGNILGGRLTDRLGTDRTLTSIMLVNVVMLTLVPVVPWSLAGGALLLFLWAANGWAVMVPQQARLVALAPADAQLLLAVNASGVYVGGALGSMLAAATLTQGGYWWTGPVGGFVGLLALAHLRCAIWLARQERTRG